MNIPARATIMGWENYRFRLRSGLGAGEHARVHLRCDETEGNLCHHRPAHGVRFFGGFDFEAADANNRMPAKIGYTKGVPMGGDLTDAPQGKAPTFLVAALKDPIGANLDRYQIVKGWLDAKGETHEQVYDVAWSGDRKPDAKGKFQTSATPSISRTRPGRTPSARPS